VSRAGLVVLALALLASGCATKRGSAVANSTAGRAGSGAETPATTTQVEGPERPLDAGPDVQPLREDQAGGQEILGSEGGGPLSDIQFEYNLAALSDEARATLSRHAQWLQQHPETRVTIEGHCDERGTVEYNLALGDLRSQSVREYLVSLGVAAERLTPVSFGKERPLDAARNQAAFARNRRAHFVVSR
jgi:peptidoglycan-associated lipoprotein